MARAEAYLHGPVRQAYLARRIQADPISRLAVWARRVAGFAVAVMLLAIVIVRAGILEIIPSLATVGGAFILAGIAILLAFAAFIVIWREGLGGFGMAMTALLVGVVILGYPAYLGVKGLSPAGDRRHHDRSDRPAALRSDRAAALARRQPDRLCGLARRRIAEERLSEHRAADRRRDAAGRLRPGGCGDQQAQMAHRRCARAAVEPARRRASRRWRARRSSASATTWWCASAPSRTACASISARPRATAGTTSAPMRRAIASLSEAIDDAIDSLKPEKTPEQVKKAKKVETKAKNQPADKRR